MDGLACFRLSVMLSQDDGPAKVFSRLRSWLKQEAKHNTTLRKSAVHEGVECIKCVGVWVSAPIAAWTLLGSGPTWLVLTGEVFLFSMALSGMALLFNRMFPKR